jgi:hypothetical protein
MPREFYKPKVKAAIIEAVQAARKAKKTWPEAHAAAKEAGFKGRVQNLMRMVNRAGVKVAKRRGRKPGRKPAAVPTQAKRGPGRPPKAKRGPGRPPKAKVGRPKGVGSIEAMIGRLVKQQVNGVLDKAIAVLKAAKP